MIRGFGLSSDGLLVRGRTVTALVIAALAAYGCGKTRSDAGDEPYSSSGSSGASSAPTSGGTKSAEGDAHAGEPQGGTGGLPREVVGDPWDHTCPATQSGELLCVPVPGDCRLGGSHWLLGESCSVEAECDGRRSFVSCGIETSGSWECQCRGKNGFLQFKGVADDGSACHAALELCGTDYLAGAECGPIEGGLSEADECFEDFECTARYDLDSGLAVVASDLKTGICDQEGGDWVCSCEGNDSASFKLLPSAADAPTSACASAADVCRAFTLRETDAVTDLGSYRRPEGIADSCAIHSPEASADSCSLVANCFFGVESWGGFEVAPAFAQRVSCERQGDEWSCDCNAERAYRVGIQDPPPEAAPCLQYLVKECHGVSPGP